MDSADSDVSVTVWALMALRAAKLRGLNVPQDHFDQGMDYVLLCRHESGGFCYCKGGGNNVGMTAAAIVALELCGRPDHPSIQTARGYLLENQSKRVKPPLLAICGDFYGSRAAILAGGVYWERWSLLLYEQAQKAQQADGAWEDGVGDELGRSCTTALTILALTSTHDQLSVFQREKTASAK